MIWNGLGKVATGPISSKSGYYTGEEILALFSRLNRDGTTLVVVTHDERLAAQAGRVIHMLDGRITPL